MISLQSRNNRLYNWSASESAVSQVVRVSENKDLPAPLAKDQFLVVDSISQLERVNSSSYAGILCRNPEGKFDHVNNAIALAPELSYIADGDVIRVIPETNDLRVLYRKNVHFNSFLVTERCNSFCLMCSQPPRKINDDHLISEILRTIELADRETPEIGLTGGEPTLLGESLLSIIRHARNFLPDTALHVLTNGRRFEDRKLAHALASVRHPDLMLGIPLYSEQPDVHDFVVQAKGAYDQTLKGLLNLASEGIHIELRVVIHRQTYAGLPALAGFIVRNIPFVSHVALMGLELTGFAKTNREALWIDPYDYRNELSAAVSTLDRGGVPVKIFNHQLCVIEPSVRSYCVRSISDWKNEYLPICESCKQRDECGGFFGTGLGTELHSAHIAPFTN